MRTNHVFIAVISLTTIGIDPATAADAVAQTAAEIKAAVVGNTDCGVNATNVDTCIYFKPDGGLSAKSGIYASTGKYDIKKDGTLCLNWDNRYWKSNCTKRYEQASGEIDAIDNGGQVQFKVTQHLQGNPKHL